MRGTKVPLSESFDPFNSLSSIDISVERTLSVDHLSFKTKPADKKKRYYIANDVIKMCTNLLKINNKLNV